MAGADSVVQIDEGTGKYLHYVQRSIASNTTYTQAVAISEPYLPTGTVAVTTAVSLATANSHPFQIMAGPLNRVLLRRLKVTLLAGGTTAGQQAVFQLLRLTTAGTGGTSYTPRNADPADAALAATAMTLPSSKGTEGNILWTETGLVAVASNSAQGPVIDIDFTRDLRSRPFTIAAGTGNGLALKNITAVAGATVHISTEHDEVFWS